MTQVYLVEANVENTPPPLILMTLEQYLSELNKNIFFREFSFASNRFSPAQASELEFADHVIWLDDLLITFQLKEREHSGNHTKRAEIKWFEKKVIGKGTKQIRDTIDYLEMYDEINITNERGHIFNVSLAKSTQPINIVSYAPHGLLPKQYRRKKFHFSSTAGLIHLLSIHDWLGICSSLITPAEIGDYLRFRQELSLKHQGKVNVLPEQALLGQFLYGTLDVEPDRNFANFLGAFVQAQHEFDVSPILHRFAERIVRIINISPKDGVVEEYRYYEILKELAKLNRNELRAVKLRYDLCIKKCKANEFAPPYRVTVPRTGCGFVFIVMTRDRVAYTQNALQNLTYAAKYDHKLEKCIGISFANDGEYYDVGWCLLEQPWIYDSEMEQNLREHYPFLEVREDVIPRYRFASSEEETLL